MLIDRSKASPGPKDKGQVLVKRRRSERIGQSQRGAIAALAAYKDG